MFRNLFRLFLLNKLFGGSRNAGPSRGSGGLGCLGIIVVLVVIYFVYRFLVG
jgi:hypothetical protein